MGIPTSVWFVIAAVALVLGLSMLRAGESGGGQARDRMRWAAQKEWEHLDSDPVLPSRWRYGTIHQGGPGVARNLVTGSVPTEEGRRLVYVFDHEQAGRLTSAVAAVQRRGGMSGALELRMPSAPLPDDAGLDLLEPVGQRYAFVSDVAAIRPMITPRLVRAADAIGEEIELLWAEDAWVLATAPLDSTPEQLEDLIDQLTEVAGALDGGARSDPALPAGRGRSPDASAEGSADASAEGSAEGSPDASKDRPPDASKDRLKDGWPNRSKDAPGGAKVTPFPDSNPRS